MDGGMRKQQGFQGRGEIPGGFTRCFRHNYDPKLDRTTDLMHAENYLHSYIQRPVILAQI